MPLSDDERELVDELRREYAAHLHDYLRADLDPAQARLALAGALLTALRHATHPRLEHLRAWLYGVARAHRDALAAEPTNADTEDPGQRPHSDRLTGLLRRALVALPAEHREVLDLSMRHALKAAEIAPIVELEDEQVEKLIAAAADRLERWVAAVGAAGTDDAGIGCRKLADLVASAPATAACDDTQISHHVGACGTCQAAPLVVAASTLPQHLPMRVAPDCLTEEFAQAAPLPDDERLWRANGFPVQRRPLVELAESGPAPSAAAGSLQAAAAPDEEEEFRAWDKRAQAVAKFWAPRPDEANPEASLSLRPMLPALRVGSLIVAVVVAVGVAGAAFSALRPERPTTVTQAAAPRPIETITLITTEPPPDPALEEPPTLAPTSTAPSPRRAIAPTTRPVRKASTHAPSPRPTKKAPTVTASVRPLKTSGPDEPPRQTTRPRSSSSAKTLPKPAAPAAAVSPSSVSLGSGRSGSIELSVSPGTGEIVSASGSNGIEVSGTRFTVSAPEEKPGCSTTTESGTITITWRGTNTGDGRTTTGTTTGGGTLSVSVTWTVQPDKGYWQPTGSVGHVGSKDGFWSNCPNGQ
ncbi:MULTISPECIES: hypothetical protein [unclassified Nonomuraea]|uniref:hypothetical protein n=1 Tax=unclassified Nonomuraea TaxID=2593643 RepID=UPI0033C71F1C